MSFDAERVTKEVVCWIRQFFEQNGPGCRAVLGISGGKDSSVAAALCVQALGRERVVGVLMPNGVQSDIDVSRALVSFLQIPHYEVNIGSAFQGLTAELEQQVGTLSQQTLFNLPARLRMSTVYAVSQTLNGRVVNTCNLSEDWIGYSTRYGDSVGDFSPLSHLTVQEVRQIGRVLGLPSMFVDKVPSDGLCGQTDEEKLGFTYEVLDRYIRTGECDDAVVKARIDELHQKNLFKLQLMPSFEYQPQ